MIHNDDVEITNIHYEYLKLSHEFKEEELNIYNLCFNTNAVLFLKEHFKKISNNINNIDILDIIINLSKNKNAVHLIFPVIEKMIDIENTLTIVKICLDKIKNNLSINPNAISFLEKNPRFINWKLLSSNPNAIFYFRFTKIKTPYKFFIHEKFIIY
jgi:hypothetical protein